MQPLNLEQLRNFTSDTKEMKELCAVFFVQMRETMTALKLARTTNDNELWRKMLHAIKGASANLGAEKLTKLAAGGEHAVLSGEKKQRRVEQIEQELANVHRSLVRQLGKFE